MDVFDVFASFNLLDFMSGPLGKIRHGMDQTGAAGASLSNKMGALTKSMLPFVAAAGLVLGVLASTVMSTVQTQKALGELGSVGITDFDAMAKSATDFSNSFSGTTKSEFLYAAYDIKSGISSLSDEGVAKFTSLAALTAKATKSTVGQMTDLFATGYGIYKDAYKDMSDIQFGKMFSAGIAASVQAFKTDGSKMAQAISTLGAQATNANVPLEEQLSILGTLQKTMPGAEAGTKYKSFLTGAAGAGKKLGLSFLDTNGQLLSTPKILEKLRSKFGTTMSAIEKLKIKKAFGSDEAVAFIDLLYSKTGDLTAGMEAVSGAMGQGEAFTGKMAQHMNQDLGASLTLVQQQFHNLLEIIGNIFAPIVNSLVQTLSSVVLWMQRLASNPVGRFFIAFAAALAVVVIALGLFSGVMWAATAAAGALNIALLANPVVLIGSAIVAAAVLIISYWTEIKDFFVGLISYFTPVIDFLSNAFEPVKAAFADVGSDLDDLGSTISEALEPLSDLFDGICEAWDNLAQDFFGGNDNAESSFKIWETISSIIGTGVRNAFILLGAAIRVILTPITMAISGLKTFIELINGKISLREAGMKLVSTFVDGIKEMVMAPYNAVKKMLSNVRKLLPFSDAKEGPLSTLTLSGQRTMETLATGVHSGAGSFFDAVSSALSAPGKLLDAGIGALSVPVDMVGRSLDAAGEMLFGPSPEPAMAGGAPVEVSPVTSKRAEQSSSRSKSSSSKSSRISIQNLTLNLPNVSNAESFARELQKLVERYDG